MDLDYKKLNDNLNIVEITDLTDEKLDVYTCCSEKQLAHRFEPEPGVFLAESRSVIERALAAGFSPLSFLIERGMLGEMTEVIGGCTVPVYTARLPVLEKLTGYHLTQGVLCAMRRRVLPAAAELIRGKRRVAVLENVMNPTNVGAVFRSAAALGMDAVLLSAGCSDPLYRRCVRVSMGAVFQIPWTYCAGRAAQGALPAVEELRRLGFRIVSMALRGDSISVDDERLRGPGPLAVLLGSEREGLRAETVAASDAVVRIPMSHGVDSLNVAAAAAVAFWELGRVNR